MIITSKDPKAKEIMHWFLKTQGVDVYYEGFQALGRLSMEGKLIGVVGYNGFYGKLCNIHSAGIGNWICRRLLWMAFDYPFNQLGIVQLIGPVASDNAKALKLNEHLGFERLYTVKDGHAPGVDIIYMGMRKEQCRFVKGRDHVLKAA